MTYKFTNSSSKAIELANKIAKKLGHSYVGTEHILYGLAKEENGVASKVLHNQEITDEEIIKKIEELVGSEPAINEVIDLTPRSKKVLENSYLEAKKLGYSFIGTEHILMGILKEKESIATKILTELKTSTGKLYNEILKVIQDSEKITGIKSNKNKENDENYLEIKSKATKRRGSYSRTPILNQFGEDLTIKAEEGKLDPVIGRNEEIEKIIQILSRRTKNNPCLIGEPGVGKTAVIEGLAQKIVDEDVPEKLRGKRIVSLDLSGMVAGTKYRGDFEERIKKTLNEVKKSEDVILFIDEIHTIVGAGAAEGAIDASNILKPLLARGEMQLIGATTLKEYKKYIERDSALERRFNQIKIEEPSQEDTMKILEGLRDKYEAHHNVKITNQALETAVILSARYINDRFLPDKAVDLIDEAAARASLKADVEPKKIKKMQEELNEVKREREESIINQKFEKAAKLRDKENELRERLKNEELGWKNKNNKSVVSITGENIAEVVASTTGIPVRKIAQDENQKLKNLEVELHKRVIGQNEAIEAVSKAIRRGRVGLKDPKRPIGSFLFLGPTGVGKTELAKAVAEVLFGDENDMIRIDMSEYMEQHSVSKLIGSPPGYVGYEEGGQLTEKIRRKPYSVILLDEIEKAHPDVMNMLLQILEDGRLTDSQGRMINFKNTVIIMTSNLGARIITDKKSLGFSSNNNEEKVSEKKYEETKKDVMEVVKKELRPEFINRIDEIIVFHKLEDKEIYQIIDLMLAEVTNRLKNEKYNIVIDKSVKEFIAKKGIDKNFGARPLRRTIQNLIEDRLAEFILDGELCKNEDKTMYEEDGKIILR